MSLKKHRDSDSNEKAIDELRNVCGTLPNRTEEIKTKIFFGCEVLEVELIDSPKNPYKAIFAIATATWGDNKYESKWKKLNPFERYIVVNSALKGKTLPTALEAPKFTFLVRGLPRHCFDQVARTRIGSGFGSIGCRDNSKLDSDFILYSEYQDMIAKDPSVAHNISLHLEKMKLMYFDVIRNGKESYQVARSLLPMSYHHPFVYTQNLASLLGQCKRRMCFGEEEFISGLHWYIRESIFSQKLGLRLIANAMRPACDFAGKCFYSKQDGSELFGNLFTGCGRWRFGLEYSEFNKSCTDKKGLEKQMKFKIPNPEDYVDLKPDQESFENLWAGDKFLLEED